MPCLHDSGEHEHRSSEVKRVDFGATPMSDPMGIFWEAFGTAWDLLGAFWTPFESFGSLLGVAAAALGSFGTFWTHFGIF